MNLMTEQVMINELNTGRQYAGGAGTQTAALAIGNTSSSDVVESWNGCRGLR